MEMEHSCEVYPADASTIISSDNFISSSSSEQYFKIEVECKRYLVWDGIGVDRFTNSTECGFSNIRKQDIERSVHMLLSYFNVPENDRPRSAAKILACAQHMANVTHKNHRIMGMRVVITNTTLIYQYEYRLRRILEESMNDEDEVLRADPACKSAIEGLERVKVEQIEGTSVGKYGNCTICFEDFAIDSEVLRLPCSHLFHGKCIINWLQNRNTCPLCRFQMPTAYDQ
ncbi:putative RING-H2 finger protein ATL37 [Neltuma alba]|uniref:putative RING-H2 finger protein ATL37 n=1 Tax=Neltuma alba TaxID=207710 RepID=UPI0010A4ACFC|nr:putative RING-H2 finger protein ATL37 [Prosopis alba]